MPEDTPEEADDDYTTTSTKTRWEGLASVLTGAIVFVFLALLVGGAVGVFMLGAIPQAWFALLALVLVAAMTWLYGEGAMKQAKEIIGD